MSCSRNSGVVLAIILSVAILVTGRAATASDFGDLFQGNDWSANIGFGSSRLDNYVGITREFPLDGHWKFHVGGGIGRVFLGGGVAWYQIPGDEGLLMSINAGLIGVHANVGYQFKVGARSFLILGAGIGKGESFLGDTDRSFNPIIAYEYHFREFSKLN